ncbi:septal ring lytic transglycosylase RlpA family protein [Psychroflexus sp. CAK1W]|uniref:septal ring lytic transglycosylase RlpA family protein n=1 Tax=Psychroflexus curvus TaxID=2873595 RepID=UPI001CCD29B6|nr:septal ring lytic transglycosylase RlpA family protein [Psychroflexus curvus]MBZ9626805.1 septal ring lytic transglycosylase RlpA family protein [Psychroflexus curvus]
MKAFFIGLLLIVSQVGFSQTQTGKASFYADKFEGRPTASGEIYEHNLATAAHRKLPFGTKVKVTNLENNKTAIVKINDRGPFIRGRIIDLSRSIANALDIIKSGATEVRIEVLDKNASVSNKKAEYVATPATNNKKKQVEQLAQVRKESAENFKNTTKDDSEEKESYELIVDEVTPNFYGVQIASFSESDNLIRLAYKLKASYKSKVLVQVKTVDQTKLYTVILGQFDNRKAAEGFKTNLQDKYPGSFIVDMTVKN